jgi:hypothetical protein
MVTTPPIWRVPRIENADEDRAWFRANPSRFYRLRPAFASEVPDHVTGWWAVVRQIAPGALLRFLVGLRGAPDDDEEETARRLFEVAAATRPEAQQIISAIDQESVR